MNTTQIHQEDVEETHAKLARKVARFYKEDDSNRKGKSQDRSIEKMVKKRIIEGRFDNPVPALTREKLQLDPASAKKEKILINKAKKLQEKLFLELDSLSHCPNTIIEDMTFDKKLPIPAMDREKIKTMARELLEELFLKMDSLSHFHPVIEDMNFDIKGHVPALEREDLKNETRNLLEELFLKLDALSHCPNTE